MSTADDRRRRNNWMAHERMNGATIRELAHKFSLSKSQVHRIVQSVVMRPPPPIAMYSIVPLLGGGYRTIITYEDRKSVV
jgi:hypothetical protein